MFNAIEINESTEDKRAGRTHIKMTALTIHNYGEYNRRGMTWIEKYVQDNIDSIIGAPFVVNFIDAEKTIPSDHGTLTYDEDGNCQFLDSDSVGTIQKAYIDNIHTENGDSKKLIVEGYLFTQRYPNFVKWLKTEVENGTNVKGSVEANGKGDSKKIIYEGGGDGKDAGGKWIIGRVPMVFDFTALAILLPNVVTEADPGSEVIEINSQSTGILPDDIKMKEEKQMEGKDVIVELNEKIVELNNQINELNAQCEAKDAELNKCKEELNACKEKETELNALLVEANKTVESGKVQVAELNAEIEPLRQLKEKIEKDEAQAEVNAYFASIKEEDGFSEAELNTLKSEYVDKCDLVGLKEKEKELSILKLKAMRKSEKEQAELNSAKGDEDTLFFSTKVDTIETNNADNGEDLFK